MSDEKPFAEVVGDAIYFDRQFGMRDTSEDKSNTAALFNSAVAARERKAAAKALRDYADEREAEARSFPLGATFSGGGLDDAPMFDVQMREVRSLRSRAAAIEGGAT